ncbi:MAG: M23 family peptidase, partial [Aquificaceae bacterium]|nr:M23 family peptidase [Aquificaceae bacterium]
MKKLSFSLFLLGVLFQSLEKGEVSYLGVGGPTAGFQQHQEPAEVEVFDVDMVNKIIAIEMSTEEAMKELLNVKTVETVRPDLWPVVGVITSDYGWRTIGGRREFHTGVDISAPYGTPVVASS